MIAASKSYRFLCVTDSRCNTATRRLMEALGADVHTITMPSRNGGFLGARVDFIRALCAADDRYVWLNQYANPNNWRAHYNTRQHRLSSASSRNSMCCSSAPARPAH
jgi:N-(2-amino-2-carboxyethyl)-L-glutamate synthase